MFGKGKKCNCTLTDEQHEIAMRLFVVTALQPTTSIYEMVWALKIPDQLWRGASDTDLIDMIAVRLADMNKAVEVARHKLGD